MLLGPLGFVTTPINRTFFFLIYLFIIIIIIILYFEIVTTL